ncbi:hypothetical protein LPH50_09130 [Xylella taiwanensis]|uniref:Uncharacterized protein n=1 Tax=Xylella taiwanensis TaxID=1444770 RepID=A0ABS8TX20_9GAMM|nr:hypothetical protein [Xylella taiwanensis]MCD8456105.1 hypothetical protein [Xylella taiwanensis]MCD8458510.1 hypothetical protein [Xylella taiwanensis]MCD8460645.1 hypothetical protein [Xylella taiwanensis]MCD8463293.1 hypothetical protein [Xylella taiwanensis]MCD8465150.1 hypothetical protein [Xylella taiwanensis]
MNIKDKRLAALYHEAKAINVTTLTNSALMLCRVFLELSTDYFLETMKVAVPH